MAKKKLQLDEDVEIADTPAELPEPDPLPEPGPAAPAEPVPPPAPESSAPEPEPVEAAPPVWVLPPNCIVSDDPEGTRLYKVRVDGQQYRHVSEAPDGRWVYELDL